MIGLDLADLTVEVVTENLGGFLGVDAADALGRNLTDLFPPAVVAQLPVSQQVGHDREPRTVRLPPMASGPDSLHPGDDHPEQPLAADESPVTAASGDLGPGGRTRWVAYEVLAHRVRDLRVLEFAPVVSLPDERAVATKRTEFDRALNRLRALDDVDALCRTAATEIRSLSGYDRVLVYRFASETDPDGLVIAESHDAGAASWADLRFPASATPATARESYLRGQVRTVPDIEDDPVGFISRAGCEAANGLNLDVLDLRAAFPTDQPYLRAIGVRAIMSVPLVMDGKLWGLLACQHQSPRRLPHEVRRFCELLSQVLALQLRSAQDRSDADRRRHLNGLVTEVVTAMTAGSSLLSGAAEAASALLGMVSADGVVLNLAGQQITAGALPTGAALDAAITAVTAEAAANGQAWQTASLSSRYSGTDPLDDTREFAQRATGALWVPIGDDGYVLWFRGEHIHDVRWASGEVHPATAANDFPSSPPLSPAGSATLAVFTETVGGTSRPWTAAERAAGSAFAAALPVLQLQRAQRGLLEQELIATTERLNARADIERLEHQLEQNQRLESLGQLAGGVAHDFNNLLAVILSYTELVGDALGAHARADPGGDWDPIRRDVDQIAAATGRAANLTRQLLTFARREVVQPRVLDLNRVITGVQELLQLTLGDQVDVHTDLADGLPAILADPGQLEQILVNLSVNARDAMPAGGTLTFSTVSTDRPRPPQQTGTLGHPAADPPAVGPSWLEGATARSVQLRVTDNGTGIPHDIQDRVFDPFFTSKPVGEGTGLGLATVHGIVARAGGTITVDSHVGLGTTFTLVFPGVAAVPAPTVTKPSVLAPAGASTVLVVEDGEELRELIRRVLSRSGYTVLTGASGSDALRLLAADHPPIDLLLTDLVMPHMTGDQLATEISALIPGIGVLLMSGYARPFFANEDPTTQAPPDHPLLPKPFTSDALLTGVREALDRRTGGAT